MVICFEKICFVKKMSYICITQTINTKIKKL